MTLAEFLSGKELKMSGVHMRNHCELPWTLTPLTEIKTPSSMSQDYLMSDGIIVFIALHCYWLLACFIFPHLEEFWAFCTPTVTQFLAQHICVNIWQKILHKLFKHLTSFLMLLNDTILPKSLNICFVSIFSSTKITKLKL